MVALSDKWTYCLEMKVRDYECDVQGVVNNANYQHYLEHTRHEYLLSLGTGFMKLHDEGVDAIVTQVLLKYRRPLRSGDVFISCLNVHREGVRYVFEQNLYLKSDEALLLSGQVETVLMKDGRILREDLLNALIHP